MEIINYLKLYIYNVYFSNETKEGTIFGIIYGIKIRNSQNTFKMTNHFCVYMGYLNFLMTEPIVDLELTYRKLNV